MKIWKYEFKISSSNHFSFELPLDSKIIHSRVATGMDGIYFTIWVLFDSESKLETRNFSYFMTGQEIPIYGDQASIAVHIATHEEGGYLFHFFEYKKPKE